MGKKRDSTREGEIEEVKTDVVNVNATTPDADQEVKDTPLSARDRAIEGIMATRHAELERESGQPLAKDEEEVQDADDLQRQVQAENLVSDMAAKVKVTIDGEEREVTIEELQRHYQKSEAADKRLKEASIAKAEAERLLKEAHEKAAAATTATEKKAAEAEVRQAEETVSERSKAFVTALYEGDTETAAKMFEEALRQANVREESKAPDPEEIASKVVPLVRQHISVEAALKQVETDYPTIWKDPDYSVLANRKVDELMADPENPLPEAVAIVKAAEFYAEKFRLDKFSDEGRQTATTTARRTEKRERKAGLDEIESASVKAVSDAPVDPESRDRRSSAIAELAAARGKSIA